MGFVQSNQKTQTSSTPTITLPSNTSGNLLIAIVEVASLDTKITIADSANNIWQTGAIINNAGGWRMRLFYAENCAASGGTNTVTFTFGSSNFCRMAFAEYSGIVTSGAFGGSGAANGSSTTASTGSFDCTSGDMIVAYALMIGGSTVAGSGYTSRGQIDAFCLLEEKTAASASETATTTGGSGAWTIFAVAFHTSSPSASKYVRGDISSSANSTTEIAIFPSNTAGNCLVAFAVTLGTSETVSIADTAGNTWARLGVLAGPVSAWVMTAWIATNCASSSGKNTVTVTFSSTAFHRLSIAEYDTTSHAVVVSALNRLPSVTSITAPNIPASTDAVVLECLFAVGDSGVKGSGYTRRKAMDKGIMLLADKESSSAEAPDATCASGETGIFAVSVGAGYTAGADFPAVTDVRDGVSYGSGTYTGTVELPAEADVEDGVMYGAAGTEFEGTLVGGGGATGWTY